MLPAVAAIAAWELLCWRERRDRRRRLYDEAAAVADELDRPLIVVGAPDCGATGGYGTGDVVIDLQPSSLPNALELDICDELPFDDDSCVVFVSCVLEYVRDADAALRELERIAGRWLYVVRVEPWCLAAYLYPNARRVLFDVPERPA